MEGLSTRSIVKISNGTSGHAIFCEALQIDNDFLKQYNKGVRTKSEQPRAVIVMSLWYRDKLGNLEVQKNYPLRIEPASSWFGWF